MAKEKPGVIAHAPAQPASPQLTAGHLLGDVRELIAQARRHLAQSVNATLVMLHWHIGTRIRTDIMGDSRAEYGRRVVDLLSRELSLEFGRGFSRRNLFNMIRFAEVFPSMQIVQTLSAQLSWSHFLEIIPLNDDLKRDFYAEMCRIERLSVRTLRGKIGGMLFERTAISRKPDEVIRQELDILRDEDQLTPDLVFRDPYLLDFLGLSNSFSERDLESAVLREIERFLLELGSDFSFIARQRRMTIGGEDFYLDLLFYHRGLRRLVAIELKLDRFTAAYKGQMELYLRWLEKYEQREGEETPVGLILCSETNTEQVELLQLDHGEIRVAEYLTSLPSRTLLESKLHEAIRLAREQIAAGDRGSARSTDE